MEDTDQKQKNWRIASNVAAILGIILGVIAMVWGVTGMMANF